MSIQTKLEIVKKGQLHLAGLRYEGRNEHGEIPALWDRFISRVGELVSDPTHWVGYGVGREIPGVEPAVKWEYLAGVEVDPLQPTPPNMVVWDIPALTYAVLPAHDVPGIGPVSQYFYQEWLPKSSEWEGSEPLMMEVYPESYSDDLIIYLYFPVKPKK